MRFRDCTISKLLAFACVQLVVMIGCTSQPSGGTGLENNGMANSQKGKSPIVEEHSKEIKALIELLEDTSVPTKDRAEAADRLGELGDKTIVKRLAVLLPGKWDLVTLEIVNALGKIGDKDALPILLEMRDNEEVKIPGKIRAVIDWSIEECQKTSSP